MSSWSKTKAKKSKTVQRRVWKGIPNDLRRPAWALLGDVPNQIEFKHQDVYNQLILEFAGGDDVTPGSERSARGMTREAIEWDVNRLFPRRYMFCDLSNWDDQR